MLSLLSTLSPMAFRAAIPHLCASMGLSAGEKSVEAVTNALRQRFSSCSGELTVALTSATDRAWCTLELSLAGESWWTWLSSRGDDRTFRSEVRQFLEANPLKLPPGEEDHFRREALKELKTARRQGLIPGDNLDEIHFTSGAGRFAAFVDPAEHILAEMQTLTGISEILRQRECAKLAEVIVLRPDEQSRSLLLISLEYFFDREIQSRPPLREWIQSRQMDNLRQEQRLGLENLHQSLTTQSDMLIRLLDLFDELAAVQDVLGDVRRSVKNIEKMVSTPPATSAPLRKDVTLPKNADLPLEIREAFGLIPEAWPTSRTLPKDALYPLRFHASHAAAVRSLVVHPLEVRAFSGGADKTMRVWSLPEGKTELVLKHHAGPVTSLAISGDGRYLASGSQDGTICLLTQPSGEVRHSFRVGEPVTALKFTADSALLLACFTDNTLRTFDPVEMKPLQKIPLGGVWLLEEVPGMPLLLAGGEELHLLKLPGLESVGRLPCPSGRLRGLALSPDGRDFAVVGEDGPIVVYRFAEPGAPLLVLPLSTKSNVLAWSPDGKILYAGGADGVLRRWKMPSGVAVPEVEIAEAAITALSFAGSGKFLLIGSEDREIRCFLLHSSAEIADAEVDRPVHPPRAVPKISAGVGGKVFAGDCFPLKIAVENNGRGDLCQLWVEVRSEIPALNTLTSVFGRLKPLEKRENTLSVLLPIDLKPGKIKAEVIFHEGNGNAPKPQNLELVVVPRTDIEVKISFREGLPPHAPLTRKKFRPGECIDILVEVISRMPTGIPKLLLQLLPLKLPTGMILKQSRHELGDLPARGNVRGTATFTVPAEAPTGPLRFQLLVGCEDGRVLAQSVISAEVG